jgi:hypothetical protein
MSTSTEALRPGISWNATRAASVLLVVIVAAIALAFWPAFESPRPARRVTQATSGLGAPHQPIVVNGEPCVQCLP